MLAATATEKSRLWWKSVDCCCCCCVFLTYEYIPLTGTSDGYIKPLARLNCCGFETLYFHVFFAHFNLIALALLHAYTHTPLSGFSFMYVLLQHTQTLVRAHAQFISVAAFLSCHNWSTFDIISYRTLVSCCLSLSSTILFRWFFLFTILLPSHNSMHYACAATPFDHFSPFVLNLE